MIYKSIAFTIGVLLASGCSAQNSPDSSGKDEQYGQEIEYEKPTDFDFELHNHTFIPSDVLENIRAEIFVEDENITKKCVLNNESAFRVFENHLDRTISLEMLLHGVLEQTAGWTTYCRILVSVPWEVDPTPELPYKWDYLQEHLNYANIDYSIFGARINTGPAVDKQKDDDPEQYQAIYPWPPSADPHYVQFEGSTTVLEGTVADFEQSLFVKMESQFRVVDHSGNVLVVNISWEGDEDGGVQ